MARIRTIKPEFPEDEKLAEVSRDARYLFVLLWTCCDDHGNFRAATPLLRSKLYPYDDDLSAGEVKGWLEELHHIGRIQLYTVDGQSYGHVTNWAKHQRVDNAGKHMVPPPDEADQPVENEGCGDSRRDSANLGDSPLDLDLDLDHDQDPSPAATVAVGVIFDEQFWPAYPRKVGKATARKAFVDALATGITPTTILEALERLKPEWATRPPDRVPHPATWLNREGWSDEPVSVIGQPVQGQVGENEHGERMEYRHGAWFIMRDTGAVRSSKPPVRVAS